MKPGRFLTLVLVVLAVGLGLTTLAWAEKPTTYTVKPGDTLWGISQKFYGDKNLWPKLWEMNKNNTTNPHQITVGDTLVIYPMEELMKRKAPPAPPEVAKSLYDRGQPLDTVYPKYFTFVADPAGIGGTGVHRLKVKKIDPLTGKVVILYDEIREVGEIIASLERGWKPDDTGEIHGKLLMSYYDQVIVRFTDDVAKVLDSANHEDPDPYFREFAIYGLGEEVVGPSKQRHDFRSYLGNLFEYKGRLTVVARVETTAPMSDEDKKRLATEPGLNRDNERVSYVAKITYAENSITIGDRLFLYKSLYPGPDRKVQAEKRRSKAGGRRDLDQ